MPITFQAVDIAVELDTQRVFENLSFKVGDCEAIHFLGRNGAGKTTLLRTLCGLIRPVAGHILFQGSNIRSDLVEFLRNIVYLGHENGLKAELTPVENLRFERTLKGSSPTQAEMEILDQLGIEHCADAPCRYLSAGQRRRVALGRLLASQAVIWLLDEPMTALDREGRQLFGAMLSKHLDSGGCAILTSHQPLDSANSKVSEVRLDIYKTQ